MDGDNSIKEPPLNPADFPEFPPTDETGDVDLSLIDAMLELTPAERLRRHAEFMVFFEYNRQRIIKQYGFDPAADSTFETAD